MTPPVAVTGVVLAGGKATRMGQDKILLSFHGRRLVDLAVNALTPLCERVLVAGRGRWIPGIYVDEVDDAEGEGPLAGIVGGLRTAATPLIAVVAADMPYASTDVLRRLVELWDGEPAVAPLAGGVVQPLHAVYAAAAADRFAELLASGERSPRHALSTLGGKVVPPSDYDPAGTAGAFWANINSPEDLAALEEPPR
jgi:molybdenum cofactor guanylyltransferase